MRMSISRDIPGSSLLYWTSNFFDKIVSRNEGQNERCRMARASLDMNKKYCHWGGNVSFTLFL